jgi:hypothetical protein
MTTLSLLGGDWIYEFEDETNDVAANVGTRTLKYVSGPVRETVTVYSAVAEAADDFQAMGFKNPILPVTPNAFTMENKAFISRASTEWLKEGTITGDWSLVGVAGNNAGRGVLRVAYTGGTNFVPTDVGKLVTQGDSTDTGTLLDYEVEPDGTTVAWIRPDDSTPVTGDLFDGTGTLIVTNGTGSTTSSTAATNGISQFTAIQAIGSVPTATEVYIVQDRLKLANSTDAAGFQFWATDPNVSLGIVSVLIRTHNAAADTTAANAIANGDLEVFARKYTSLYDNFRLNVNAGGFSALPLASAPDINNTTGYRRNVMTGSSGTWTVGNAVYVGASFAAATMKGIITAENAGTLEYYLIGDLTDLTGSESLKEYDFVAEGDGDATATGAVGGSVANLLGPTDTASGEGGSVTITLGNTTRDHDNSGTAEPYSIIIDAQGNVAISKVYERIKYATRRGATAAELFGAGVNVPGETYRGLQGLYYYDTLVSGPFGEGEDIFHNTGTWTARSMAVRTTVSGEDVAQIYFTTTDEQTSLDSIVNNDVIEDESGSTVTIDTAGAGGAALSITSPKSSPLGTFTGTQIFGAQGVDYRNPDGADTQAYILTDDLGTLRSPPNTISFTVANTRALDKIFVARDTGTAGVVDKDQFGGMTAQALSLSTLTVAGTVDGEVPATGVVRVVDDSLEQEHRYYFDTRTTGAGGVFNLHVVTPGTATAGTSTTLLEDTGADFITDGVEVGMLIRNITTGDIFEVVSVTDLDTLVIKQVFGTGGTFVSTNTYEINETIVAYTTSDNIYDTIIDKEEDTGTDGSPGSISNTFVKDVGTFGTVVQVRQGKIILPFEQNQTVGQTSVTVTTVRTPDSIAV